VSKRPTSLQPFSLFTIHSSFSLTLIQQKHNVHVMRITVQLACLVSLFFLLVHAWNHQFEPAPDGDVVSFADLQWLSEPTQEMKRNHHSLSITAGGEIRHATFALPCKVTSDYLFICLSAQAKELMAGDEIWQDGRTYFEWLTPENKRAAVSYLHSARDNTTSRVSYAIRVPKGDLRPVLRIENLAKQGDYLIQEILITPAQHTRLWKWMAPSIMVAFVVLISSLLAHRGLPSLPRRLTAASVTVIMGYFFMIPGPWPQIKGLGQSLVWQQPQTKPTSLTEQSHKITTLTQQETWNTATSSNQPLPPPPQNAQLPEPENLVLRAKKAFQSIRPFLHFTLLFFPVWIVSYSVGTKRGLLLGLAMAIGIESAQWLFGYGFQEDDLRDLFADACGIAMAGFCHHRLSAKIHSWLPFSFPRPLRSKT
jgi:hypothetical protein